jgi:hypothetical protein
MHSSIERLLAVSKKLPQELADLFNLLFKQGLNDAQICSQKNWTQEYFVEKKNQLLRYMRTAN